MSFYEKKKVCDAEKKATTFGVTAFLKLKTALIKIWFPDNAKHAMFATTSKKKGRESW